nr:transposase [Actinopolyspora biskrensis]
MLTQRHGIDLDTWITAVRSDNLPAMYAFTDRLTKDQETLAAGITLPYINGLTEGVINKIKMLKRKTYGRVSFALLRKRILLMN